MENHSATLSLKTAPFFNPPQPGLREKVQRELEAVSQVLVRHLKGVTVLLTGSFSAGEGKVSGCEERPTIASDYDLVAVTPRLLDSFPPLTRKKLQKEMGHIRLSADLDISLVWKPFLLNGVTTTAGFVIGGAKGLESHLLALGPPSAYKADLCAYLFLARAPLEPCQYSILISKAVVRSAQAFLLDRFSSHPRSTWVQFSSTRCIQEAISRYEVAIGSKDVGLVRKACHALQGMTGDVWTKNEYPEVYGLLNRLNSNRVPARRWQDFIKHALWLKEYRLAGPPCLRSERYVLESLKLLCNAWMAGDQLDIVRLTQANRRVKILCHKIATNVELDPVAAYARMLALLAGYINFYPHKLRYPGVEKDNITI